MSIKCFKCSAPIELGHQEKVSFSEECDNCYADIHSCRMCQFYDPRSYNECREPSAERILEKEKRNFCDYFMIGADSKESEIKDTAISAAEALFKK